MAIRDKVSAFLRQLGTSTGSALSGNPSTVYYGNMAAQAINPGGLLGSLGMTKTAGKLQLAYQDPRNAQLIGAGVLASGGLAAATGATAIAAALASKAKKKNIERNLSEN